MNKKIYIITIIFAFVLTFILLYYVLFYKKEHNTINSNITKIDQSWAPIEKKVDFEVKFDNMQNLTDIKQDKELKRN